MAHRWRQRGLLCFATVLGCCGVGAAQAADQDLMAMKIEDLSRVQVYSASRHLEDIRKAPASVSIVTAEDIRRYGWRTLSDALRTLRGFYTAYDRQYTYLGARGFLRPGDYNSRILLLVDGHRMNDNVYDGAAMGDEFPLNPELVDHIEVVRGPGSSLFGTNAFFGVINVVTRRPAGNGIEISGNTGSFLGRAGRVTGTAEKGGWAGLISGDLERSAGPPRLYFPQMDSPATNNGYAVDRDGEHLERAFADVRYRAFRLEGLIGDRIKSLPTGSYATLFNDPANRAEDTRGFVEASLETPVTAKTDLDLRASYDGYNFAGQGGFAYAGPGGEAERGVAHEKARSNWAGIQATVTRRMGNRSVTAGGDYETSFHVAQRTYLEGQPSVFASNKSTWNAAFYADAELSLTQDVLLHAGTRIDWAGDYGRAVSPRFAVVYTPASGTTLKYIVGEAFRAPNAYEEHYADWVTLAPDPTRLSPERILSNEAALDQALTPWLSVTLDGYYNQLRRLIDQVPDSTTGLSYFVNDGRVHAAGLEMELQAAPSPRVGARASYAILEARDDVAGSPLANSPRTQVKLNGVFPVFPGTSGAIELVYVSALTDYRGTRVPGYRLPAFTLMTRPFLGGLQISSSCYNAFNGSWFSPLGPNDPEDQIPMDGRTWRVSVSYRRPGGGGGREP